MASLGCISARLVTVSVSVWTAKQENVIVWTENILSVFGVKTPFTNLSALVRQSYGPCMSRLWSLGAGRIISGQDFVFRIQVVHYFFLGSRALFSAEPPSVDGGKAKKHEK